MFWNGLNKTLFTRLSPENGSPYILTLAAAGLRGEILQHMCRDKGMLIGTGSACSSNAKLRYSRVILACGYDEKIADGVLRISFSEKTSEEEIVKGIEILNGVAQDLARKMK